MENYILFLGLLAAFFTTFAYLPQSIRSIRTRSTKDLSLYTLIMLEIGTILWLCYGLLISSIPVIAANTLSIVIISIILILKLKYS